MINRENFEAVQKYLEHCASVRKNTPKTVGVKRWHLRHLLEWADETPLTKLEAISTTFVQYLNEQNLAYATQQDICHDVRQFLKWLKTRRSEYRAISEDMIDGLRPDRDPQAEPQNKDAWTLEDVRKIARLESLSLTLQRAQAAVVFLFLSAMRITAFVTLPIQAIDLANRRVRQWPSLGVRTKLNKAATTHLLDIPDLLIVAHVWDDLVRQRLAPTDPWYAHIHCDGKYMMPDQPPTPTRSSRFRKELKTICNLAGVPYKRPHALRHGHALYALGQADTFAQVKAISMNLMHENTLITDQVYGVLSAQELQTQIESLGKTKNAETDFSAFKQEIIATIRQALVQ